MNYIFSPVPTRQKGSCKPAMWGQPAAHHIINSPTFLVQHAHCPTETPLLTLFCVVILGLGDGWLFVLEAAAGGIMEKILEGIRSSWMGGTQSGHASITTCACTVAGATCAEKD